MTLSLISLILLILSDGMRTLDLSHNRFPSIPVEIGNMELLKVLHEWEVGIGLFQLLQELNVSYCQLTEWPNHIEKIPSLQLLNFAGNQIETVPKSIGTHTTLKYLDLSENKLRVFPTDFYSLTQLQVDFSSYPFPHPYRLSLFITIHFINFLIKKVVPELLPCQPLISRSINLPSLMAPSMPFQDCFISIYLIMRCMKSRRRLDN